MLIAEAIFIRSTLSISFVSNYHKAYAAGGKTGAINDIPVPVIQTFAIDTTSGTGGGDVVLVTRQPVTSLKGEPVTYDDNGDLGNIAELVASSRSASRNADIRIGAGINGEITASQRTDTKYRIDD